MASFVTAPVARRLGAGFAFLFVALASSAQVPAECPPPPVPLTVEAVQEGARSARDHGFFWRITKGDHSSYLYGTIHVARREWMFPGPTIRAALRLSDTVALEVDLLDSRVREAFATALAARPRVLVPDDLLRRIERRMAAECVAPESLLHLGPDMQVVFLGSLRGRLDGLDPSYGIDNVLSGIGHGNGKNVVSLETAEEQLQALQMSTLQETIESVESALEELESDRSRVLLRRIAAAWAASNYEELERFDEWCGCRSTEGQRRAMKRLLDDRNGLLAERIDALHSGGRRVFAAVGSLHMFGPLGLPALLAQRGYTVERAPVEP